MTFSCFTVYVLSLNSVCVLRRFLLNAWKLPSILCRDDFDQDDYSDDDEHQKQRKVCP